MSFAFYQKRLLELVEALLSSPSTCDLVVNSLGPVYGWGQQSQGPPSFTVEGLQSNTLTWLLSVGSLDPILCWRRGRSQEAYHLPGQNSWFTSPHPRFLRAFCDSNRSVHYAQYLGGSASEASLRYGGSKTPGSPIPSNSVHRHPPGILKRLTPKDPGK